MKNEIDSEHRSDSAARAKLEEAPPSAEWLICLSHLRWNFVFQRPQHIMSRLATGRPVLYVEEPLPADGAPAFLEHRQADNGVTVIVPHMPRVQLEDAASSIAVQRRLLDEFMRAHGIVSYTLWYYTPMALAFTDHLRPLNIVYDCMDELSAFAGAPPEMRKRESQLLARADLVLTGGRSLYEAKRTRHPLVRCVPSSVDVEHFRRARSLSQSPRDQETIPRPRMGFAGVIDERMDLPLIDGVARQRPDWSIVLVGPIVKVDRGTLPSCPNIHYLGMKSYQVLPSYMAGWDVGILPFARNEATRFISPTKTPEYLAAGCRVVSTSIKDVVRPYGVERLALIADSVPDFIAAIETALQTDKQELRERADRLLRQNSWDRTARKIVRLLDEVRNPRADDDDEERLVSADI